MISVRNVLMAAVTLVSIGAVSPVFAAEQGSGEQIQFENYYAISNEAMSLARAAQDLSREASYARLSNLSYLASSVAANADRLYRAARGICGRVNPRDVDYSFENTCESYEQLRYEFDMIRNNCDWRLAQLMQQVDECFEGVQYLMGGDIH